jgi:hypothetical protein
MQDDISDEAQRRPWYRYPLLWMVISGPAAVVVAGFATLWIAIRMPDPVVSEATYSEGRHLAQALAYKQRMPAMAGRNHAATPEPVAPSAIVEMPAGASAASGVSVEPSVPSVPSVPVRP